MTGAACRLPPPWRGRARAPAGAPSPAQPDSRGPGSGAGLLPAAGPLHGPLPAAVEGLARRLVHARLKPAIPLPQLLNLRAVPPEADGQAGQVGRAQGRGLVDDRAV